MPRYLSAETIEAIASRVLRAYAKLPEVQENGFYYVVPNELVHTLLGLTVEFRHLSEDGDILGLTCFDELGIELPGTDEWFYFDGKTVLIEEDLLKDDMQYGRRGFTIVHEGCHHILKMLYPEDYAGGINMRRVIYFRNGGTQGSSREEHQVNALTAAVLMPEFLIRQGMKMVGLKGRIDILHSVWRKDEYDKFCSLAYLLGVSKQALSIRMRQLGLLGRDFLKNPGSILDILVEEGEKYDF